MTRRYANLMIIPEGGGRLRQFRIQLWPVYVLFGIAFFAVAFVVGAGAVYVRFNHGQRELGRIREENETLRAELVLLGTQMSGLDATVRDHIHLANESRLLAGLPPFSEEVALLGVGGTPSDQPGGIGGRLSPALERTVEVFRDRMQELSRQLAFQEESFVEVKQLIEVNRDRLDHIPTINPVQGRYYLSSGFGRRRDPFTGRPQHHNGLDFCAEIGTPFVATAAGEVVSVGRNGGMGKTIKIDHGNGYVTMYGHCEQILVSQGQVVRRGDVIGKVGNTGRSTGPHLHYEVRQHGRPVNPRPYILKTDT